MEERSANWKHLKRFFELNKIPLGDDLIAKILNQAPNAGFQLLCGIYKFLTKKE